MPNWCQNTATINAPRPVIDEIRNILEDQDQDSRLLKWMRLQQLVRLVPLRRRRGRQRLAA